MPEHSRETFAGKYARYVTIVQGGRRASRRSAAPPTYSGAPEHQQPAPLAPSLVAGANGSHFSSSPRLSQLSLC
jgi:hypothetical protein